MAAGDAMRKAFALAFVVAIGLGGLLGAVAFFAATSPDDGGAGLRDIRPAWTEPWSRRSSRF